MNTVRYETDGRIARITLNRPQVLNAIDAQMPAALAAAVAAADADPAIHVILLAGNGAAFCAGYDLAFYGENTSTPVTQAMPWDPLKDYAFMWQNTQHFLSLWRALKPVVCKVHGVAVAGGADIALCADLIVMAESAQIGYMPARVWGCPTTAMWVYRLGMEQAKRLLFTGDKIDGREAARIGLVLKAVAEEQLDAEVEALLERMASVPINQLMLQKMLINQAVESTGMLQTQRLATIFDGISRHSPEGLNFKRRLEQVGWKQAVSERDQGRYDWTHDRPFDAPAAGNQSGNNSGDNSGKNSGNH